ncbi:MAG: hypothetical protein HRF48_05400 [Chloroflexota bacterium]
MRKALYLLLILALVVAGGVFAHAPAAARAETYEEYDGCPEVDAADGTYPVAIMPPIAVFYAGDTIELSAEPLPPAAPLGASLNGYFSPTIYLKVGGVEVDTAPLPGTLTYTFSEDTKLDSSPAVEWGVRLPYLAPQLIPGISADWTTSCASVPPAGCDVLMKIPSTAVVGAFVANAPLYFEPGEFVQPYTEIAAGSTAWVLGKDASGEYYKIIWVCDYLWVPVNTLGPNYDVVWNGTPLPQDVVE